MIFQWTHQAVIEGRKTQTRRIQKAGEFTEYGGGYKEYIRVIHSKDCRVKYQIGQTLAVQPGRTQKGIARIRITAIRAEDVRNISIEDVKAEGFEDFKYFWFTWCKMYDPGLSVTDIAQRGREYLMTRPAERYQAWALTFELVTQEQATAAP